MIGEASDVITADTISTVYQCPVLVDKNPISKTPRVTVLSRRGEGEKEMV